MTTPLSVAVVTGGHAYDVRAFEEALRSLSGVDFYVQSLDDFTYSPEQAATYDVVLFYTMHRLTPGQELPWYQRRIFSTLETLGTTNQGIVILHHALVAFLDWPLWSELIGMQDRTMESYHFGESVTTNIAAAHPITESLTPWTMTDETYRMPDAHPEDGNTILLTTDHPQSMATLAWTRQYRNARVFCYQSGHDGRTFDDQNFRRVLERGISWAGNRI